MGMLREWFRKATRVVVDRRVDLATRGRWTAEQTRPQETRFQIIPFTI